MKVYISKVNSQNNGMEYSLTEIKIKQKNLKKYPIKVNYDTTYQNIDGFGISITEASCVLYNDVIQNKEAFVKDCFDREDGIGISFIRQPIGPTDHVSRPYSFVIKEVNGSDFHLDFSYEEEVILPLVKEAYSVSKNTMNIMASPWTAPDFMKENNSILGLDKEVCVPGFLKKEYYGHFAEYITSFVEIYKSHGLPMFAITPVNEPDFANYVWPSMPMTSEQQKDFIVNYLYPNLVNKGLDTKIMCWDHNFDSFNYMDGSYAINILEDLEASKIIDGTAWHWYVGSPETMTKIHNLYPDKGIWITEASGGEWGYKQYKEAFEHQAKMNLDMLNNYAQSIIYWNLALDEHGGPDYFYQKNQNINSENRGLISVSRETGEINYNVDYFTLGHFSKFIPIGSIRVDSILDATDVYHVTFITPQNETVIVAYNDSELDINIEVNNEIVTLLSKSLNTIVYSYLRKEVLYNNFKNLDSVSAPSDLDIKILENNVKNGLRIIVNSTYLSSVTGELVVRKPGSDYIDISEFQECIIVGQNLRYYDGQHLRVSFYDGDGDCETIVSENLIQYNKWSEIIVKLNLFNLNMKKLSYIGISFDGQERDIYIIEKILFR